MPLRLSRCEALDGHGLSPVTKEPILFHIPTCMKGVKHATFASNSVSLLSCMEGVKHATFASQFCLASFLYERR